MWDICGNDILTAKRLADNIAVIPSVVEVCLGQKMGNDTESRERGIK